MGEKSMFDIEDCVGFQISNAAKVVEEHVNNKMMSLGITRVQWIALYYIGLEKSINQSCLAKKMRIKSSTAARLIDRMEQHHYVKRVKNTSDKRIIHLQITKKGRMLREHLQGIAQMTTDELNNKIPVEDYMTFINILKNIIDSTYY
ncbi:MarR family transcriptional regulator [Vallitalea pronyensis]|uniref:MarR family transcriptional regulator n=1 Tax=Vallitalea pronyensis TaxID=1348613 RepID=A0A8J8MM99_9FIRM|nr:MarR family transcriptional regulator [Vallitalea pronyensis]QUI24007.1 MarR family transcriptional regulator [Vallitalea pronyensis]